MKHKIIWGLFVLLFPLSAMSKVVDYCKVISFDSGAFDLTPIELKSLDDNCISSSVPIFYNRIKHYFWLFNKDSQDKHLYYLKFNSNNRKYEYDLEQLSSFLSEVYSNDDIVNLKRTASVKETPEEAGILFEFTIVFYDDKNKPCSMLKTLLFHSKENYSAIYHSGLIEYENKKEVDYINRVGDLFKTIDINFDGKNGIDNDVIQPLDKNTIDLSQENILFCSNGGAVFLTQSNVYPDRLMDKEKTERDGYLYIYNKHKNYDVYKVKIVISAIDDTRANVVVYHTLFGYKKGFFYSIVDINNHFDDIMVFEYHYINYLHSSKEDILYGDDIKNKCLNKRVLSLYN